MPGKATRLYLLLILLLSALLKCVVYLQNRSLFLDECNLSRNFVEKSYSALFGPLDYEQFAPPLYSCVAKFCTQLFGVHEFSLRLFSLLLGLGSLYLFYQLALKLFDNVVILYPVLLFGFSIFMLRYNTENKQYSADVFFALLFIWVCWNNKIILFRDFLMLGLAGAVSLWFSMPLAFILAGVGCYLFYEQFKSFAEGKSNYTSLLYVGMMIFLWLLSFALLYYFNLKEGIESKYLQDYHAKATLKWPTSLENIQQSYAVLRNLLSSMVGHPLLNRVWAAACIGLGIYTLLKRNIGKTILILVPIATCFLASLLNMYVLLPRLSLFLMPLFFLLIGLGAAQVYEKIMSEEGLKKYITLVVSLVLVVLTISGRSGIPYFVKSYQLEHSRPVIQELQQYPEQNLPVYVYHNGVPAYQFYTQLYEPNISISTPSVQYGIWSDQLPQLAATWKEKGFKKIWIFDSHTFGDELEKLKRELGQIGQVKEVLQAKNTDCYLVEL